MNKQIYKSGITVLAVILLVSLLGGCTQKEQKKERIIVHGDLHCHSNYSSDSKVPVETVISESAKAGYDFIALTEHNTQKQLKKDHSTQELIVLPGYELTLKTGHINLFGVRTFDEKTSIQSTDEVTDYINYFHSLGGLAQVNHPNSSKFGAKFGLDIPMDLIEVWNGHFTDDDRKSLSDWQNMLVKGRKIVATAGRDEHKNHLNNCPNNNVYVEQKTSENILENIKKGHLYLTALKDIADIQLSCGDAIMGDTVDFNKNKKISLKIDHIPLNSIIKVYSDKGIEFEEKYINKQNTTFRKEFPMNGRSFYRAEVWTKNDVILAISNPIYVSN